MAARSNKGFGIIGTEQQQRWLQDIPHNCTDPRVPSLPTMERQRYKVTPNCSVVLSLNLCDEDS